MQEPLESLILVNLCIKLYVLIMSRTHFRVNHTLYLPECQGTKWLWVQVPLQSLCIEPF